MPPGEEVKLQINPRAEFPLISKTPKYLAFERAHVKIKEN